MKKHTIIVIVLLLGGTFLQAQTWGTQMLYDKYSGREGVIAFRVPGVLMRLGGAIAGLDAEERAFLRSVRSVRILTIDEPDRYPGVNFTREARINPDKSGYQLMVKVTDGGEDVMILGREKNGRLKDLLVLVGGDDNVMVHIRGRMNADMVGSLTALAGLDQVNALSHL